MDRTTGARIPSEPHGPSNIVNAVRSFRHIVTNTRSDPPPNVYMKGLMTAIQISGSPVVPVALGKDRSPPSQYFSSLNSGVDKVWDATESTAVGMDNQFRCVIPLGQVHLFGSYIIPGTRQYLGSLDDKCNPAIMAGALLDGGTITVLGNTYNDITATRCYFQCLVPPDT